MDKKHLKSKLSSRKTKLLMYKSLTRPILIYASETSVLSKADERSLILYERRVLRCNYGAVQCKSTRRKRHSHELYKLFNEPGITKYIVIIYV
jgi:hypothetical protein